ncbi:MAG: DUF4198 domain-containing protein [Desulfovibrio sp.]|nr:DUF4198 domain-containing protein [Desulfovibrio sp.]
MAAKILFRFLSLSIVLALCLLASPCFAHFGTLLPSKAYILSPKDTSIDLIFAFSHPMTMNGMSIEKPKRALMLSDQGTVDITDKLTATTFLKEKAWKLTTKLSIPDVYLFGFEPQPYFEPAEDCFIVHYTKVCIPALGEEFGWDQELGFPIEIVPLTRPFGNYAGNIFQGKVLHNKRPAANCTVEIEFYNKDKKYVTPNPYFETQTVKTDDDGVFTFVAPWSGWWAFSALTEGETKLEHDGNPKDVEIGGVLWVNFGESK